MLLKTDFHQQKCTPLWGSQERPLWSHLNSCSANSGTSTPASRGPVMGGGCISGAKPLLSWVNLTHCWLFGACCKQLQSSQPHCKGTKAATSFLGEKTKIQKWCNLPKRVEKVTLGARLGQEILLLGSQSELGVNSQCWLHPLSSFYYLFESPSHFCSTLWFVVLGPEFVWYGNASSACSSSACEALVTALALYKCQWLKASLRLFFWLPSPWSSAPY